MFWSSVGSGLQMLANWQTYVAAGLFFLISMGPTIVIGIATARAPRLQFAVGCLSMLFVPFFQTFALIVFILTLSPLLLGLGPEAAWLLPWKLTSTSPLEMAFLVGKLLVAALLLTFIPVLGRLHSLHTLLLGSLALVFYVGLITHFNPGHPISKVALWPGFVFIIGLLLVGAALSWLGIMLAAFLMTLVDQMSEGFGQLLMFRLIAVLGFIPVFIYGAWIASQIKPF